MNKHIKLLLVVLIATSFVEGVTLLRREGQKQNPISPGVRNQKSGIQIFVQDKYDDYAEILAEDPVPDPPFVKPVTCKGKEEIIVPIFVPDNPQTQIIEQGQGQSEQYVQPVPYDQNVSGDNVVPPSQEQVEQPITEPIIVPDNTLYETETQLTGSDLVSDAIDDAIQGETDPSQSKNVGAGDIQQPSEAFGGDSSLTFEDLAKNSIEHKQDGQAVETELKVNSEEVIVENETQLTGSDLVSDAIEDTMYGESDSKSHNVGAGDTQQPSEAFAGDSSLQKEDIDKQQIQHQEGGQAVETELKTTSEEVIEENETQLTGSDLVSDAIEDTVSGESDSASSQSVGAGDVQNAGQAFEGDSSLEQEDLAKNAIQHSEDGRAVETELKTTSEEVIEENETQLTGSDLVSDAIEDTVSGESDSSSSQSVGAGDVQSAGQAFEGDSSLEQEDLAKNAIQHQEDGRAVETELKVNSEEEFEENEPGLSGSHLVNDAVMDQIYGEKDQSGNSVGSGDIQTPAQAFSGDLNLSAEDVKEGAIEHQENGKSIDTDLEKTTPSNIPHLFGGQKPTIKKQSEEKKENLNEVGERNSELTGSTLTNNIVDYISQKEHTFFASESDFEERYFNY